MKILLTGGTGSVGKAICERLDREGDRVTVIGRHETAETGNADYRQCDVTDFDCLLEVSRGMDAVIHLAGIPSPGRPAQNVFQTNVTGTFNVYEAALRNGIGRVVTASSINAFGFFYGVKPPLLPYLPLDEEAPGFTTDPYSFSKEQVEEIGRYYYRRSGITGAAIRIPWVYHGGQESLFLNNRLNARTAWDEIAALSEKERKNRINSLIARFDAYRTERYKPDGPRYTYDDHVKVWSPLMGGYCDFYTAIDARDSAQGFDKAAKADYDGAHTLFINDSHNTIGLPSRELAELMYPAPDSWTGDWKSQLSGTESLVSIEKARKLIGFEPKYSIKRFYQKDES